MVSRDQERSKYENRVPQCFHPCCNLPITYMGPILVFLEAASLPLKYK